MFIILCWFVLRLSALTTLWVYDSDYACVSRRIFCTTIWYDLYMLWLINVVKLPNKHSSLNLNKYFICISFSRFWWTLRRWVCLSTKRDRVKVARNLTRRVVFVNATELPCEFPLLNDESPSVSAFVVIGSRQRTVLTLGVNILILLKCVSMQLDVQVQLSPGRLTRRAGTMAGTYSCVSHGDYGSVDQRFSLLFLCKYF